MTHELQHRYTECDVKQMSKEDKNDKRGQTEEREKMADKSDG